MIGQTERHGAIIDMTPYEVADGLKDGTLVLIDVREPSEYADEHIEGAINMPLSDLNAEALSQLKAEAHGRVIVMQCLSGGRSAQGVKACRNLGEQVDHHLSGGINAWKAAGLSTKR